MTLAFSGSLVGARADVWDAHVRPLLENKCLKCHGGVKKKGGLDLRSLSSILKGGETGPAVVPGQVDASLLFELIQPGADPHMPPKGEALTSDETFLLRTWIEGLDGKDLAEAAAAKMADWDWAPPEGTTVPEAINLRLAAGWQKESITLALTCDDATFARRAYIDLAGRIPTPVEVSAFCDDARPEKRGSLVHRLMESDEFPKHMTVIFDTVFLLRDRDGKSGRGDRQSNRWFDYLHWAFTTNRPWNQMASDMLLARPNAEEEMGAAWFLAEKKDDPNAMATETARTLLGKQIQCAQCHDHPISPEIEHKHYWGMVAFFKRTYRVKTPEGIRVAEAATGGYSEYKDLGGQSFAAELAFLNGKTLPEERNEGPESADLYSVTPPESYFEQVAKKSDEKKEKKKRKGPPEMPVAPVPKQSRRALLAQEIVSNNPDFAAAAVNRFWAYLTGRGLVHPVDQMDSAHPASHPQLLTWLARDFALHGYNARRLIAGIMASHAYQLDSTHPAERPPLAHTFARMVPKPLPAEALYRSLLVASGKSPQTDGSFADNDIDDHDRLILVQRFPALFPEVVSPDVGQSLFFTNNPLLDDFTSPVDDASTAARMIAEPDLAARTQLAFQQVLSRAADADEVAQAVAYFENRPVATASEQLLWALMASSEFRFNR